MSALDSRLQRAIERHRELTAQFDESLATARELSRRIHQAAERSRRAVAESEALRDHTRQLLAHDAAKNRADIDEDGLC